MRAKSTDARTYSGERTLPRRVLVIWSAGKTRRQPAQNLPMAIPNCSEQSCH
jgi:hypothetical protein